MGDIISNFKIENPDRPNKAIVYPFALILLLFLDYTNFKFGKRISKLEKYLQLFLFLLVLIN